MKTNKEELTQEKPEAETQLEELGRAFILTTSRMSKKKMQEMNVWELRQKVFQKKETLMHKAMMSENE